MTGKGWPFIDKEQVLKHFKVNHEKGLSYKEADNRLRKKGLNTLKEDKKVSLIGIFLDQFKDFMVLVLLGATLLSGLLGEFTDAITIIIIVVVNAILGFVQEFKAEKSLNALKKLTAPKARLIRDGGEVLLPAEEIAPGDIVYFESGDRIPADIRLFETINLNIDESPLTGESVPVEKKEEILKDFGGNLGDYINMAFMGTLITSGRGKGVVVATGMDTEMGKIAHLLQEAQVEDTPLQKRLEQLGKYLVAVCLFVCVLVALLGIYRGEPPYKMLMAGVSLAVAAIPEGLPAIVTIALAIGVQRMIKRKAIVRKLPAVETLGCATVICSDKTGTLTQNKMTVQEVFTEEGSFSISGEESQTWGDFYIDKKKANPKNYPGLLKSLEVAAYCNNAAMQKKGLTIKPQWRRGGENKGNFDVKGDPTEAALLIAAAKGGIWKEEDSKKMSRIREYPFDSTRKRMGVVYEDNKGNQQVFYKGAPDVILDQCRSYYDGKNIKPLKEEKKQEFTEQINLMASRALRNIAVAWKEMKIDSNLEREPDRELIFLGIFGMQDPPRPEVAQSILKSRRAGIKTVMITGDHKVTALAVANKLNLMPRGGRVLTGKEMDSLDDNELFDIIEDVYVYARVAPKHKLRIVRTLKKKGHVVAMTGDGVNDAPAVKEADIGIAMGKLGTDVTKEAADLILGDDNYSTIVAAVEEGRSIYDNIKKFIRFLLSCNVGEIMTMFLAMVVGLPVPLKAIQILWINLVTDGLPAIALGVDPADKGIMNRPPRPPKESIFAGGLWQNILIHGINIGIVTLLAFSLIYYQTFDLMFARTVAFSTLIVTQLFHVFNCRKVGDETPSLLSNPYLIAGVFSSAILLLIVIYNPFLQKVFQTVPLTLDIWLLVIGMAILPSLLSRIFAPSKIYKKRVAFFRR